MERVRGEMCSVVVVPFSLSYIPTKSTNQSTKSYLELNGNTRRIKTISSQAKVHKDLFSIGQLLGNDTSGSKHSKTSILQLLGLDSRKFLGIIGFQAQRIEAYVAGVMIFTELLEGEASFGLGKSDKSTVVLKTSDKKGKTNQEEWSLCINLVQLTDGWSNILVVSLEEWVVLNRFLNNQHAKHGKHGNASVLCFCLTPL
mmetsp:Transcript_1389/g.2033  ORF Transcript_1389/g.2033 Transcript_1389/m.2033 type:complete len:200 (+) Transcript_1389:75-674(+)